jgi:hypothetical protein
MPTIRVLTKPCRRLLQFRLRTLLLGMAALGVAFAWFGQQVWLTRERATALAQVVRCGGGYVVVAVDANLVVLDVSPFGDVDPPLVPVYSGSEKAVPSQFRRWLGDMPVMQVCLPESAAQQEFERLRALFPETYIWRLTSDRKNPVRASSKRDRLSPSRAIAQGPTTNVRRPTGCNSRIVARRTHWPTALASATPPGARP